MRTGFTRPGKPTDNARVESFNGTFRQEYLNACWFMTLSEASPIRPFAVRMKEDVWHENLKS